MNDVSKVTHSYINDLRIKKQAAIDVLDFETAEDLENQIQFELDNFAKIQISDVLEEAKQIAGRLDTKFQMRLEDEAEIARQNAQKIYAKYQVIIEDLEQEHINQLMENENDRAFVLIQESEREIEEQLRLLEEAKKEATLCHFDHAKELRQQARDAAEAELERRRVETEEKFAKLKEEIIERQKAEIAQVTKDHEQEVSDEKANQERTYQKTQSDIQESFTLLAKKAIARFNAVSSNKKNIDEATEKINDCVNELIIKFKNQPRVIPELSNSETMRVDDLPPTEFVDLAASTNPSARASTSISPRNDSPSFTVSLKSRSMTATNREKNRCTSVGLLSKRPMSKLSSVK